jgi:hypothetical protein
MGLVQAHLASSSSLKDSGIAAARRTITSNPAYQLFTALSGNRTSGEQRRVLIDTSREVYARGDKDVVKIA